jgi:hypothetical protein
MRLPPKVRTKPAIWVKKDENLDWRRAYESANIEDLSNNVMNSVYFV